MTDGTKVGFSPHIRQEASPTESYSPSGCACGADADGYDASRGEPVCQDCARLRCDGGTTSRIPRGWAPDHNDPDSFFVRCTGCDSVWTIESRADAHRKADSHGLYCAPAGVTPISKIDDSPEETKEQVVVTDGGSNLYTCDTPHCGGWKEVVTPDGYVCHDCADELEKQYQGETEEAKLLTDSGVEATDDDVRRSMSDPEQFWLESEVTFPETHADPHGAFAALGDALEDSGFRAVYDETNGEYLLLSEVPE